ncbi:MAG: helix-turn-helix domain-containing protein [Faecousia sp.]
MEKKLQGFIIRKRRQELKWSQAKLSQGICAMSYLSKIEQGKAEGSPEVIELLLQRLGIRWNDNPAFRREAERFLEECYDHLFAGDDNPAAMAEALAQRQETYRNSPFFLDWLLLAGATEWQPPAEAEEFLPAMDARQRCLYLAMKGDFRAVLQESSQSLYLLRAGMEAYWGGDYGFAIACLQRGVDQAAREGSLPVQMRCRLVLGNCYSNMNQMEQVQEHYSAASRMARCLNDREAMTVIAYNQATTELQMGLAKEALRHLLECPWNEALYFHKLAICYEKLGQKEEARAALEQAVKAPLGELPCDPPKAAEIFEQMCRLVRIRLDDPNYLQSPEYGRTLRQCIRNMEREMSAGFVRFHATWLAEWYAANRQYRKAYELVCKFS